MKKWKKYGVLFYGFAILLTMVLSTNQADAKVLKKEKDDFCFVIEDGIARIDKYIGKDTKVILPNKIEDAVVSQVSVYAFERNEQVTSITIPSTITSFYYDVDLDDSETSGKHQYKSTFHGCSALSEIQVEKSNPVFMSEDGILYSRDQTILLQYPQAKSGKSFCTPDEVTEIGPYAFAETSKLKKVTMLSDVKNLGIGLFCESSSIREVRFSAEIKELPIKTFYGSGLEDIVLGSSMTEIGNFAFARCSGLTRVRLPEGIKKIGYQAFAYCDHMITIQLPSTVESIINWDEDGACTLRGCTNLREIYVENGNHNFFVEAGLLYQWNDSKHKTSTLIYYPPKKRIKEFKMPEHVTRIESWAFEAPRYLERLYLSKNLNGVMDYFKDCDGIVIYVPKNVAGGYEEGHAADWPIFKDCKDCCLVVYKGSKAEKYCKDYKIPYINQ